VLGVEDQRRRWQGSGVFSLLSTYEEIGPDLGFSLGTTNFGMRVSYRRMTAGFHYPEDLGSSLIRAQNKKGSLGDLTNILPLDLSSILNSQFNIELNTHFIISQHIEKLYHNS
jgi:hypothetical protein